MVFLFFYYLRHSLEELFWTLNRVELYVLMLSFSFAWLYQEEVHTSRLSHLLNYWPIYSSFFLYSLYSRDACELLTQNLWSSSLILLAESMFHSHKVMLTNELYNLNLSLNSISPLRQIFSNFTSAETAVANIIRISIFELPEFVSIAPRYLKCSTFSICLSYI